MFFAIYGGLVQLSLTEFLELSVSDKDWFLERLIDEKNKEQDIINSNGREGRSLRR